MKNLCLVDLLELDLVLPPFVFSALQTAGNTAESAKSASTLLQ